MIDDGDTCGFQEAISSPMDRDPQGASGACLWCGAPFAARTLGPHRKKFCSSACRATLHKAARKWVLRALGGRYLTVEAIKSGSGLEPSYTTNKGALASDAG